MQLTQKETDLLKDLKNQEKVCIEKFTKYSAAAKDPQLKNLFTQLAGVEQQHLSILTGIENGEEPNTGASSGAQTMTFTATYGQGPTQDKKDDCYLCSDSLGTEKHTSSLYDTCVFEFANEKLRTALNSIQKQEQGHGKMFYDYMKANNMYF